MLYLYGFNILSVIVYNHAFLFLNQIPSDYTLVSSSIQTFADMMWCTDLVIPLRTVVVLWTTGRFYSVHLSEKHEQTTNTSQLQNDVVMLNIAAVEN